MRRLAGFTANWLPGSRRPRSKRRSACRVPSPSSVSQLAFARYGLRKPRDATEPSTFTWPEMSRRISNPPTSRGEKGARRASPRRARFARCRCSLRLQPAGREIHGNAIDRQLAPAPGHVAGGVKPAVEREILQRDLALAVEPHVREPRAPPAAPGRLRLELRFRAAQPEASSLGLQAVQPHLPPQQRGKVDPSGGAVGEDLQGSAAARKGQPQPLGLDVSRESRRDFARTQCPRRGEQPAASGHRRWPRSRAAHRSPREEAGRRDGGARIPSHGLRAAAALRSLTARPSPPRPCASPPGKAARSRLGCRPRALPSPLASREQAARERLAQGRTPGGAPADRSARRREPECRRGSPGPPSPDDGAARTGQAAVPNAT